ncbi:Protein of unknown function [Pyronema omphalodes CBS 100304]|uniref:Uncharacterized protein n=1 Tax=Pyronema omphalodes (strain CBS 100304) TaxID=1076935 RepID=U4LLA6_PYROM|nr:Protein of unknown function [Pyronema omphalodes CBS 100304]
MSVLTIPGRDKSMLQAFTAFLRACVPSLRVVSGWPGTTAASLSALDRGQTSTCNWVEGTAVFTVFTIDAAYEWLYQRASARAIVSAQGAPVITFPPTLHRGGVWWIC